MKTHNKNCCCGHCFKELKADLKLLTEQLSDKESEISKTNKLIEEFKGKTKATCIIDVGAYELERYKFKNIELKAELDSMKDVVGDYEAENEKTERVAEIWKGVALAKKDQ